MTFDDLERGQLYPLFEVDGNKIKIRKCAKFDENNVVSRFRLYNKVGRPVINWYFNENFSIPKEKMNLTYFRNYFLNKEEAYRFILSKLKSQIREINKKMVSIQKEMYKEDFNNEG